MKLLDKSSATSELKKSNDELIETNIRLRKYWQEITRKLNTVKDSYEPDKLLKLKEFEQFSKSLIQKKSALLKELRDVEKLVEDKKEMYYKMIEKQDQLTEKEYQIEESNKKLNLRQAFVEDLEEKYKLSP